MFWEQQGGRAGNGEKKRFAFLIFISVFLYHSDFRIKFLRSAQRPLNIGLKDK